MKNNLENLEFGKNINLRFAEISDAVFLFELRATRGQHLSPTSTLEKQIEFLENYKKREANREEFYFIIESRTGEKLGAVRIYGIKNKKFCWGSWLIKDGAPMVTGIESALMIYQFGFCRLRLEGAYFDVRKDNQKVVNFHKRSGAKVVGEDDQNIYFEIDSEIHQTFRDKYRSHTIDWIGQAMEALIYFDKNEAVNNLSCNL